MAVRAYDWIAHHARNWGDEKKAFAFIQEDLAHLYSLSYYPQPNPSAGWRTITVKLVGKDMQKYHVRTRAGYRLQQAHAAARAGVGRPAHCRRVVRCGGRATMRSASAAACSGHGQAAGRR